jgi:hypothetical protein
MLLDRGAPPRDPNQDLAPSPSQFAETLCVLPERKQLGRQGIQMFAQESGDSRQRSRRRAGGCAHGIDSRLECDQLLARFRVLIDEFPDDSVAFAKIALRVTNSEFAPGIEIEWRHDMRFLMFLLAEGRPLLTSGTFDHSFVTCTTTSGAHDGCFGYQLMPPPGEPASRSAVPDAAHHGIPRAMK